jgi:hypothetical protein
MKHRTRGQGGPPSRVQSAVGGALQSDGKAGVSAVRVFFPCGLPAARVVALVCRWWPLYLDWGSPASSNLVIKGMV